MAPRNDSLQARLGPLPLGNGRCLFTVWAPKRRRVELILPGSPDRIVPMEAGGDGGFRAEAEAPPGTRYLFRLDGGACRPDPASRSQPEGVHGPSAVTDPAFAWTADSWRGLSLEDYVLYELHVGTFTPEGTFDAVIPRLGALKELGITAVELMPVAQFPGKRNWGYDGVYPYAAQESYGGPRALKRLVDACHAQGLAAVLDVVYNHLGPEGNYLPEFGPYFSERHKNPWGAALNFDGPGAEGVRRFFLENALYWLEEFRFDALRLDAVHGIPDDSPEPFLRELAGAVESFRRRSGRRAYLIAESDLNESKVIRPAEEGGFGLDAQWSDDFHHALHALLTGERTGYYQDFGKLSHLAQAYAESFVYSGQRSAYRGRPHGDSAADLPPSRFVVCAQNHDQVGNRARGDRLGALLPFEARKLAAGATLLSPCLPLLFMGEEYGETAPFQYFVDHSDLELIGAVRRGRAAEFSSFGWGGQIPDPADEDTFLGSKLRWELRGREPHATLLRLYRRLLELRRSHPALAAPARERVEVRAFEAESALSLRRRHGRHEALLLLHFGREPAAVFPAAAAPDGRWRRLLDSAGPEWGGPGGPAPPAWRPGAPVTLAPWSFALYERE